MQNIFEYVLAAISVLSFLLSLLPFFQRYKSAIKNSFIFTVGMLSGAIVSRANASQIILSFEGSVFQGLVFVLLCISSIIVVVIIISLALSPDRVLKQDSPKGVAGITAFGFFMTLAILFGVSSCDLNQSRMTASELMTLAKYHEDAGDVPRALAYYQDLLRLENSTGGTGSDAFKESITRKIEQLMNP